MSRSERAVEQPSVANSRPDGRDTRWARHREQRRAELVDAALRAVRRHGPAVGMDEIAAEASTSKTVLYRHFGDRAGLYVAVVNSVERLIARDLENALAGATPDDLMARPQQVIEAAVDSYLVLVEKDPDVYRFVVNHPLLDRPMSEAAEDPVSGLTARIGDELAAMVASGLAAGGRESAAAGALGHGVVGLVRAAADHWLSNPKPLPRKELTRNIAALVSGGLAAVVDATTSTPEVP